MAQFSRGFGSKIGKALAGIGDDDEMNTIGMLANADFLRKQMAGQDAQIEHMGFQNRKLATEDQVKQLELESLRNAPDAWEELASVISGQPRDAVSTYRQSLQNPDSVFVPPSDGTGPPAPVNDFARGFDAETTSKLQRGLLASTLARAANKPFGPDELGRALESAGKGQAQGNVNDISVQAAPDETAFTNALRAAGHDPYKDGEQKGFEWKVGINPATNKREHVRVGPDGVPMWSGVESPESSPLVQFGTPMPAIDEKTGESVFVQPQKTGGVQKVEGFSPPDRADQRKAKDKEQKDLSNLSAINSQIDELQKLVTQHEGRFTGTTGIKGLAGRAAETVRGQVDPDAPTPALDAVTKKELLIASLRKYMADSNMSKSDRDALEKAIGGFESLWSTKGSTLRALDGLREFVRNKFGGTLDVKPAGKPISAGKPLEFDSRPDPNDFDAGDVKNGPEGSHVLKIIGGKKQWVKE